MSTILYLHGFNSAGNGNTAKLLQLAFPAATVVSPTYEAQYPLETFSRLRDLLEGLRASNEPLVVVGTSLGGFWAERLSRQCGVPALGVNPAITPSNQLSRHVGRQTNFSTGEVYDFTLEALAQYALLEQAASPLTSARRIAAVFQGDEVIDVATTCARLKTRGDELVVFPGGQHRISDAEIPLLVPYIRMLGVDGP